MNNKKIPKNKIMGIILLIFISLLFNACDNNTDTTYNNKTSAEVVITQSAETTISSIDTIKEDIKKEDAFQEEATVAVVSENTIEYDGVFYTIIEVEGGDKSGSREANVAVEIGFGDRAYWGFTNKYGQLVAVIADKIILQDDSCEPVNSDGRYYDDEAAVPGTEREDLDQGHVIADSLGGVSNAYNITPQDSTLNRHGDQAYMEKVIRDAGGCTNFVATITYPNTNTQVPSHYHYEYDLKGNHIIDDFNNENPEKANAETTISSSIISSTSAVTTTSKNISATNEKEDLASVDSNGDGKVTIAEAKAAGYKMPIKSDFWLYKYMDDRDHDGMVGE